MMSKLSAALVLLSVAVNGDCTQQANGRNHKKSTCNNEAECTWTASNTCEVTADIPAATCAADFAGYDHTKTTCEAISGCSFVGGVCQDNVSVDCTQQENGRAHNQVSCDAVSGCKWFGGQCDPFEADSCGTTDTGAKRTRELCDLEEGCTFRNGDCITYDCDCDEIYVYGDTVMKKAYHLGGLYTRSKDGSNDRKISDEPFWTTNAGAKERGVGEHSYLHYKGRSTKTWEIADIGTTHTFAMPADASRMRSSAGELCPINDALTFELVGESETDINVACADKSDRTAPNYVPEDSDWSTPSCAQRAKKTRGKYLWHTWGKRTLNDPSNAKRAFWTQNKLNEAPVDAVTEPTWLPHQCANLCKNYPDGECEVWEYNELRKSCILRGALRSKAFKKNPDQIIGDQRGSYKISGTKDCYVDLTV